jgi:hypothetical protein
MSNTPNPIAVDEHATAAAIGMSVHWLRKDRRGQRVVPFFRIGGAIRYDLQRVREALVARCEEGGPSSRRT